jgi:hypothetical protein
MPNVPRKFYKYMKQEHLRSFFRNGDIRIGTLHDFQSNEKHNYQILDSEEGIKSANKVINWSGGPDDQPAFDRKFFRVGADNVTIKNILLMEEIRSPNCFIFSVSASFSVEVMKKMNPGYDACIAILKPYEFFREIANNLQDKISKWAFGPCYYITRNLPHDKQHNIHPAWIKDPEYSYQEEYRMIMIPNIDEIQPLFIKTKYATKFCKPHYIA